MYQKMTCDGLLDPSLPHVSFGDTVAPPPTFEGVTYYLKGPKVRILFLPIGPRFGNSKCPPNISQTYPRDGPSMSMLNLIPCWTTQISFGATSSLPNSVVMCKTPVYCQFYQHFTSYFFCTNILLQKKLQIQTAIRGKLHKEVAVRIVEAWKKNIICQS